MKKTLQEELNRFRAINSYAKNLMMEQEIDPNAIPPVETTDPNAIAPVDPAAEIPADLPPEDEAMPVDPEVDDNTEEVDVTDLVNMTKSIKKELDSKMDKSSEVVQKMDDVFSKLNDLEAKLGEMDQVISKIDQLGSKIDEVKPKTPIEKLEMRSLDSYPFNVKPDQFFDDKQEEMRISGKNEYVLTKSDVENYGKSQIMNSFDVNSNPYQ